MLIFVWINEKYLQKKLNIIIVINKDDYEYYLSETPFFICNVYEFYQWLEWLKYLNKQTVPNTEIIGDYFSMHHMTNYVKLLYNSLSLFKVIKTSIKTQ